MTTQTNTTLPEERFSQDFPELAEAMAAHCITTTVPDEPDGQPLEIWVMPVGWVAQWMKIAVNKATALQQQAHEAHESEVRHEERERIKAKFLSQKETFKHELRQGMQEAVFDFSEEVMAVFEEALSEGNDKGEGV